MVVMDHLQHRCVEEIVQQRLTAVHSDWMSAVVSSQWLPLDLPDGRQSQALCSVLPIAAVFEDNVQCPENEDLLKK